VYKANRNKCFT